MPEKAQLYPAGRRTLQRGPGYLHYESLDRPELAGNLLSLAEVVLAGDAVCSLPERHGGLVHILPLVGPVRFATGLTELKVHPVQSAVVPVKAGSITLTNPHADNEITVVTATAKGDRSITTEISEVDLDSHLDRLLFPHVDPAIRVGQFNGRRQNKVKVAPGKALFIFVVEGAFEVQGRLLERRDGLSLTEFAEVEFESLSDYAIIWMIEL